MARRRTDPELQVRAAFEPVRVAPQRLASAYEMLVPIPRRLMRPGIQGETPLTPTAVAGELARRRVKGG